MKLSWLDIELLCLKLHDQMLEDNYKPDMIIGVARGGLVPATILASLLKVKDVTSINIRAYSTDRTLQTPELLHSLPPRLIENKSILIVDDIVDTGSSCLFLIELLNSFKVKQPDRRFASLIYRENKNHFNPTYYGQGISKDEDWIIFPWESKEK